MRLYRRITRLLRIVLLIICSVLVCSLLLWIQFCIVTKIQFPSSSVFMNSTTSYFIQHEIYHDIPLIVHQTWKDRVVPNYWKDAQMSWMLQTGLFPHWPQSFKIKYVFWDDKMIREFIAQVFPWFSETFNNYKYNIQRADAARYFLLYYYGGVYSDLDVKCNEDAVKIILDGITNRQGVVLMATEPDGLSNDVMVASRYHPFMKHVISGLRASDTSYIFPYFTVLLSTGSIYLTRKFRLYKNKSQIHVVNNTYYTNVYFKHYEGGSWHRWDGNIFWYLHTHKLTLFKRLISMCCLIALISLIICTVKSHKVQRTRLCR